MERVYVSELLGFLGGIVFLIVAIIFTIIGSVVWFIYMKIRYKTVSSNEALIVTGPKLGDPERDPSIFKDNEGRYMKIIRGGGHRLKLFQSSEKVSLNAFQLDITTPKVYTLEGVPIEADAIAMLKVADNLQGTAKYAEQFLGRKQKDIEADVAGVLGSNLRAILSKMTVEQINNDRESFNTEVRDIAQQQLDDMGFKITSLGLTDIRDADGSQYLVNLGRKRAAEVKRVADMAEASNTRDTKVHSAKMNEETKKEEYEREVSIAEARKEKELKDAMFKEETERARAKTEAAYALEQAERELEVEKERLKVISQNKEEELRLMQMERERNVKLEQEEAKVRKEKADAEYYEQIKKAEAEAEAKKKAGQAEAEVIRQTSIAEIEAIERRAEALAKNEEVMMSEMIINMLPEFARAVSEPLANVESIRIIDGGGSGNGNGVRSLSDGVTGTMVKLQESLSQMTGIDLSEILNNLSKKSDDKFELSVPESSKTKETDREAEHVAEEEQG